MIAIRVFVLTAEKSGIVITRRDFAYILVHMIVVKANSNARPRLDH